MMMMGLALLIPGVQCTRYRICMANDRESEAPTNARSAEVEGCSRSLSHCVPRNGQRALDELSVGKAKLMAT